MSMSESYGPFLVTGAGGNVGSAVVDVLLSRGAEVRAALHSGLPPNRCKGALVDFRDPKTFKPALSGVKGLFLMRPNPVLAVKKTLNLFLDTAVGCGIKHCVFLSVAGADRNKFVPHYAVEQHLMTGSMSWTLLRAGFFSQNLTGPYRKDIRQGKLVLPAGSGRVAYVDARDLGEVAARALMLPQEHSNRAYHLTGPDALMFSQVAELLSVTLKRPISYEPSSLLKFYRHSRSQGVGRVPTIAYALIHASLRNGSGAAQDPALAHLLGRPGRGVAQFIEEKAAVWNRAE